MYVPLYAKGEMTLGLNNSMASGAAYRGGVGDYKGQNMKSILGAAAVLGHSDSFMVPADSGIKTLDDLRGKKVVTTIKAVTSLSNLSERILQSAGIADSNVTPMSSGNLIRNIDLVVEGRADAATQSGSIPPLVSHSTTVSAPASKAVRTHRRA